ncbi:signal peptide peptidase SppA [Thermococcus waiotapuensis]|uniref:Signal peptide peptidase SppA n=1 Tax=Thermococcus waiotapuensis TaxID=90909 RepID=A0AAE4T219_9EURY|nr:signal peptide peptidase SppA [Thermococcus waiotapuensis]MDV3103672.1 signal peptide peptidase SppA [Thermococcus waiotapuensis]
MKSEVWKYISLMLVLILGVFVTSTALLYLQNQSIGSYTPPQCNCTVTTVNQTQEEWYRARIAELEAQLRAIELGRNVTGGNVSIAVVPIFGIITEETALYVVPTLEKLAKDDSIGGVLLWIESPGGAVGAVREIYKEVLVLRARKPVVAYTGGIAASGGYYIAVASDEIIADPLAEVGSIGVIYVHYNMEKNYAQTGINVEVFKTGPYKDMGGEWRGLTPEEKELIWDQIQSYFRSFLDVVSLGRNMTEEEVKNFASGRTWFAINVTGSLVDSTGNFQTAVEKLEKLMGVRGAEIRVYDSPTGSYSLGPIGSTSLYLDPRYLKPILG